MGGKRVAEGVRGNAFLDSGFSRGLLDGALQAGWVDMVAAFLAAAWIQGRLRSGEDVLPDQLARECYELS